MKHLAGLMHEGIAAGEFRPVAPHQTAFTMLGTTAFYFASAPVMKQVVGDERLSLLSLEARRHALLDFVEHGLFRNPERQKQKGAPPVRPPAKSPLRSR